MRAWQPCGVGEGVEADVNTSGQEVNHGQAGQWQGQLSTSGSAKGLDGLHP